MKKKRRKMKKKAASGLLFLLIVIITSMILVVSFVSTKNNNDGYDKLKKEVNDLVKIVDNNTLDMDNLKVKYKTKISKNEKLEDKIEKYLLDVANILSEINEIKYSDKYTNSLDIKNIKKDNYFKEIEEYYINIKEELTDYKTKLENININDYINKDDEDIDDYKDIISNLKIDKYISNITNLLEDISLREKIITYLKDNTSNYEINEKITFQTKQSYEEFNKLLGNNEIIEYELVKDTKGPVINASDISITIGTNYDLSKNINCTDDIDGKVECSIKGEYNTNKIGDYKVEINSTDSSNNTSKKEITISVKEKVVKQDTNKNKYYTEVIRNQNTVIVYGLDDNNNYTKIVKVFPCSVGLNNGTPTGTFKTSDKYVWRALFGGVYGQYATRFNGSILFHSVPYTSQSKNSLEWEEYNKLGTAASMGCVRMAVADVKWIYDNCPSGMTVKVYDGELPNGVEKPTASKIDANSPNKGWDPTDPDKNNPWNK